MNLGAPAEDDPRTGLTRLVSGEPPWAAPWETAAILYPALYQDATCDVVVLGAGVTGAMCAALLVGYGLDVMLVDRNTVAGGSTSANTALLLFEPDQPLYRLEEMLGERDAAIVYRLCHQALDDIAVLATGLDASGMSGSCSTCFSWRPSLILASDAGDVAMLHREHDARRRHGYPTVLLIQRQVEARYCFSAPAALRAEHAAEMNPYRFTRALVAAAVANGLRVHERTSAVKYCAQADGVTLTTERGCRIRAKQLVVATGYETERYTGQQLAQDNSTFAILTQPLDTTAIWADRALVWETARPYIYMRTTDDNRVLIGGLDEPTVDADHRDRVLADRSRQLAERLRSMLPGRELRIARAWAGTFLNSCDWLPYIGQLPEMPHTWFALSYGGNGTTFGMIAATMLGDAIRGRAREDARIFRFDRATARERASADV